MVILNKKKREEILQDKFPEFYKLINELKECVFAVSEELDDRLTELNELEELMDEVEEKKTDLL